MTEGKRQISQQLLQEYDIETAEDIREASERSYVEGIFHELENYGLKL